MEGIISILLLPLVAEIWTPSPNINLCTSIFGRFAAALIQQKLDCWVMNVVPVSGFNTLPVIYDRGLLGVMHDWYYSV